MQYEALFRPDALTSNRRRRYCIRIITQRVRCEYFDRLTCIPETARRLLRRQFNAHVASILNRALHGECKNAVKLLNLQKGESYVNKDCTQEIMCVGAGKFVKKERPPCHRLASCSIKEGERRCFCQPGYVGDGVTECKRKGIAENHSFISSNTKTFKKKPSNGIYSLQNKGNKIPLDLHPPP